MGRRGRAITFFKPLEPILCQLYPEDDISANNGQVIDWNLTNAISVSFSISIVFLKYSTNYS